MRRKLLGFYYLIFGFLCFYFSSYWFFYYTDKSMMSLVHQYSYFTNQTTLICGFYCAGVGLYYMGLGSLGKFVFNCYVKVAMMSYILMVSIGYYIGVVKFCMVSWEQLYVIQPQSIFMHLVIPIVMAISYNTTPIIGRVTASKSLPLTLYPLSYLFYASIYSMFIGEYIYPILDPSIMGYGLQIPLYVLGACVVFWVIGFLVGSRHNFCLDHQQNQADI